MSFMMGATQECRRAILPFQANTSRDAQQHHEAKTAALMSIIAAETTSRPSATAAKTFPDARLLKAVLTGSTAESLNMSLLHQFGGSLQDSTTSMMETAKTRVLSELLQPKRQTMATPPNDTTTLALLGALLRR